MLTTWHFGTTVRPSALERAARCAHVFHSDGGPVHTGARAGRFHVDKALVVGVTMTAGLVIDDPIPHGSARLLACLTPGASLAMPVARGFR
jgi:hypothetical protein